MKEFYMRIFNQENSLDGRINFVDENNVFVGFAFSHQCCETFGYVFIDEFPKDHINYTEFTSISFNEEDFYFDTHFFKFLDWDELDNGRAIAFRLVNNAGDEVFLLLFNCHNGWYSHGFDMILHNNLIIKGNL
jgi:hypothetical protein